MSSSRKSKLMRRGAIIVVTDGPHKGKIGKIIVKPYDTLDDDRVTMDNTYGIEILLSKPNGIYNNIPVFLIAESCIRYAYPYEKLLRRRNIHISSYENPFIDKPIKRGKILIKNDPNMSVHTVIPNLYIVTHVQFSPRDGKDIVTLRNISSNKDITCYVDTLLTFLLSFRELNQYEIRKLNRYAKTIRANQVGRREVKTTA